MSELDFMSNLLKNTEVEWKTLGDISIIYGGLTGKNKNDFEDGNASYVPYKNIFYNIAVDFDNLEAVKISNTENQREIKYGDILFTGSSEIPDEAGMSSAITQELTKTIYLNSFSFGVRFNSDIKINPHFSKYLFRSHFMRKEIIKTASGVTRFNISKARFKKIQIPIPPLNIQTEIVRILDVFTELTAELTAELVARKQQYTYYREQLLTFKDDEVEWKALGEIATINTGQKPSDVLDVATAYDYINAGTSRSGYSASSNCEGDTVTTPSRGQGGIGYVGYQKQRFWLGALCYKMKSINESFLINKYLFYFLQSRSQLLLALKKEGGVPAVNKSDLAKLEIPLPPLAEQQRIVTILDKFDALTTSLTEGLPREIALRQQQYEYYRELLLSFPKPEVANHD